MNPERMEHLIDLSEQYGIDLDTVLVLADTLGPNEDYDGLPAMLSEFS